VQTLDYRYLDFSTGTKGDDDVFLESNNSFTAPALHDILNRVELFGLSNNYWDPVALPRQQISSRERTSGLGLDGPTA
jgi:hypothetical protein